MGTELVIAYDENYSPDERIWYGSVSLIECEGRRLNFATAKTLDDDDKNFKTCEALHNHLKARAFEAGWKWDRAIRVGS